MSLQIPNHIVDAAYEVAADEAKSSDYISMSLAERGNFIDRLVLHPNVGGRLKEYLNLTALRTYIKDALLRKYAKKQRAATGGDETHLQKAFGRFAQIGSKKDRKAYLLERSEGGKVFAAVAYHPRWEVGLRNLLLYRATCNADSASMALVIVCPTGHVNGADKSMIEKALSSIAVDTIWSAASNVNGW